MGRKPPSPTYMLRSSIILLAEGLTLPIDIDSRVRHSDDANVQSYMFGPERRLVDGYLTSR